MSPAPYLRALAAAVVVGALSWRHYQGLPALTPPLDEDLSNDQGLRQETGWPRVQIVVPARDEARRLPALLASLRALDYPSYEVVVVDDNSADDTAGVAEAGGARVIRGAPLPDGWTGKAFACHQGAAAGDGAWLLFTDADTVHEPASLRAAIAYARRHELGALSLMTEQRCKTPAERLLLPLAYAVLFAGVSPRHVNALSPSPPPRGRVPPSHFVGTHPPETRGDRRSHRRVSWAGRYSRPSPLANGQYMLYRRETYAAAGGHAAIRASIIEDAALARALARHGIRYRLCRGESLVSVRMYGSLGEVWSGFRKNAARYVLDDPRRLPATALYSAVLGTTAPLLGRAARMRRRLPLALALLAYGTATVGLTPWYRRFGVPGYYALLHPLAAGLVGLITLDSSWRLLSGRGVTWRGRKYK